MRRRAFTLIELTVVILVLALLAASIMPNVASAVETNRRRAFRLAVPRMMSEAHNRAVQGGQPVFMSTNTDDGFELKQTVDGEETVLQSLDAVNGVSIDSLLAADGSEPSDDWQIGFYPDGTSDGGIVELNDNGTTFRYQVAKTTSRVRRLGEDDQLEDTKWQAGDLAVRGGTGG